MNCTQTKPLGGTFDYATDYSILIQLCILCNIVYMRDIKVFGVLFVGRLLLILLEQDCTCLPCNLLNTISSCVHQRLYFISRWHAPEMNVVYMHSLYVTHRCNKTDCQICTDLDFLSSLWSRIILFSWILDCEFLEWLVLSIQKSVHFASSNCRKQFGMT